MARFREAPFDILVTDLKMRKPDGLDMLKLAREIAPRTHVFVITGFPTIDAAREAMKGGAVDFIPRPFEINRLREMVIAACRRQDETEGADG
jgi:DNA-binding NtrC family response regulator